MAAPLVTGAIALVEAAHPSWTMSAGHRRGSRHTSPPTRSWRERSTTGGVLNVGAAVANTDGPYVVSSTPDGSINSSGGFSTVQLTFNEEINPATFTAAEFTLTGPGGVIPASVDDRHRRRWLERSRVPDLVPGPDRRRGLYADRRSRRPGLGTGTT